MESQQFQSCVESTVLAQGAGIDSKEKEAKSPRDPYGTPPLLSSADSEAIQDSSYRKANTKLLSTNTFATIEEDENEEFENGSLLLSSTKEKSTEFNNRHTVGLTPNKTLAEPDDFD